MLFLYSKRLYKQQKQKYITTDNMFHGCTIPKLNITINKLRCVNLCALKAF